MGAKPKNKTTFEPFGPPDFEESNLLDESIKLEKDKLYGPKDTLFLALIIFFIQGMGVLFPWNAFISAPDYFLNIFGDNAMTFFGVCYSIPNIISLAIMTLIGGRISLTLATIPSYAIMFLALVAMPLAMYTPLITFHPYGFIFTLGMVVVCGFMTASVQSGVFGFAGVMPGHYMTSVMSGNGVAGLFVALLRALTKFVIERNDTPDEQKLSVTIFFIVASMVLIVCILTYLLLTRLSITRHYLKRANEEDLPIVGDETENEFDKIIRESTDTLYGSPMDEQSIIIPKEEKRVSIITVFLKIWREALEVFLTFAVTLCIFPGLSLAIPSQYKDSFMAKGWFQIFIVIQFNFWDTIGRSLPIVSDKLNRFCNKILDIPVFARILFLPLICLSLKLGNTFLGNDIFVLVIIAIMSLTNGYFSSLLMTFAPRKVEAHEGRIAGTMMTFFLVGGIVAGTNLSLLVLNLLALF